MIPVKSVPSGLSVPVLGLGTWQMGGLTERDPANDDERDVRAIQAALDAGITHLDTAEIYAAGRSEELVGQALRGYDRSGVFLASKASPANLTAEALPKSLEASLRRLETDYLDLYLVHRFNPAVPLAETMQALNEVVDRGLVRHIGVCNFSADSLRRAQAESTAPIVCNQVHYNLKYREPETSGLLRYCQDNGVLLSAWRPLQYGELLDPPARILVELSGKYAVTPAQVALNWLTSQPMVITLVKTLSPAHLQENVRSVSWELAPEDVERLRVEYPDWEPISNRIPLDSPA